MNSSMHNFLEVVAVEPNACAAKALDDFRALVLAGGEVTAQGLENRIRLAVTLVFLNVCCCLSGVAALKRPEQGHRRHISEKSRIPILEAEYPFELGWVFVMPSARGRGFSRDLTQAALAAAGNAGVFATSRTNNTAMYKALLKFGFQSVGEPYQSDQGDYKLQLFLRPGSTGIPCP